MKLSTYLYSFDIDQTVIFSDYTVLDQTGEDQTGGDQTGGDQTTSIETFVFDSNMINKIIYLDNKPFIEPVRYYQITGEMYEMNIGDICVIGYRTSDFTVVLPIKMSNAAIYDMFIHSYINRSATICSHTQPIVYLRPNGLTYTNQFYFSSMYMGSTGSLFGETTESAFRLGALLLNGYYKIFNFLNNKRILFIASLYGNTSNSTAGIDSIQVASCSWNNITTQLEYMGILGLANCSSLEQIGLIYIRRIV